MKIIQIDGHWYKNVHIIIQCCLSENIHLILEHSDPVIHFWNNGSAVIDEKPTTLMKFTSSYKSFYVQHQRESSDI